MKTKLLLLLAFAMVLALSANAVTFTVDGLCYQTASGGVNVVKESSGLNNYAGLTNVVIPSVVGYNGHNYKVVRISAQAFRYAQNLETVEMPNTVTMIGDGALFSCPKLRSVKISSSVKTIGTGNFKDCAMLEELWVDPENTVYDTRDSCNALIKTSTNELIVACNNSFVPATVETIANNAFYNLGGIKTITIPSSVTNVGYEAFAYCTGLEHLSIESPLESLGIGAFECCHLLRDVQLCEGLKEISYGCFEDCHSLGTINFPQSLTVIDSCAFRNCYSLTSIEPGDNLERIGANAFADCTSLKEAKIPDSVKKLGNRAFYDCYNLLSAYVGEGVTSLGHDIFLGCSKLEKLTIMCKNADYICEYEPVRRLYLGEKVESIKGLKIDPGLVQCYAAEPPVCDDNTFENYYGRLYVPEESVEAYSSAPYWENFSDIVGASPQVAGDVNGDYVTTAADVTAIYDILLGNNEDYIEDADVNGDGNVTASDVTAIYDLLLGASNDIKIILGTSDQVIFKSLNSGVSSWFYNTTGEAPFDIFRFKGNNYLLSMEYNYRANIYRFGDWGLTLDTMLGGYHIIDNSVSSNAYGILVQEYANNEYHHYVITKDGNITSRHNVDNNANIPAKMCLGEDGSIYVVYSKWNYPTTTQSIVCRDGEVLYELNASSSYLSKMMELDGDLYVFSYDSRYWKNGEEHAVEGITSIIDAKIIDGSLCLAGGLVENNTAKAIVKIGDVVYDFSSVSTHPTVATCCEMVGDDLYTLVNDYDVDEEYIGSTWLLKNGQVIMTIPNKVASKFIVQYP